jgi:hypothetical protein
VRYGFTGTRSFKHEHHAIDVFGRLLQLHNGTEFWTGACVGLDDYVAQQLVQLYPWARHVVVMPHDRRQVDPAFIEWAVAHPKVEIIWMPEGTTMRDRNTKIVENVDRLEVFPYRRLAKPYSGTWMTANIADKLGVPTDVLVLQ